MLTEIFPDRKVRHEERMHNKSICEKLLEVFLYIRVKHTDTLVYFYEFLLDNSQMYMLEVADGQLKN